VNVPAEHELRLPPLDEAAHGLTTDVLSVRKAVARGVAGRRVRAEDQQRAAYNLTERSVDATRKLVLVELVRRTQR
jgi:uncharacterized protein YcfJ